MSHKESKTSCPFCEFANPSGNEADLNYHLSSSHPEEWKKKNKKIQEEAKSHMQKKFGKDYIRTTAQKEPKIRK